MCQLCERQGVEIIETTACPDHNTTAGESSPEIKGFFVYRLSNEKEQSHALRIDMRVYSTNMEIGNYDGEI